MYGLVNVAAFLAQCMQEGACRAFGGPLLRVYRVWIISTGPYILRMDFEGLLWVPF